MKDVRLGRVGALVLSLGIASALVMHGCKNAEEKTAPAQAIVSAADLAPAKSTPDAAGTAAAGAPLLPLHDPAYFGGSKSGSVFGRGLQPAPNEEVRVRPTLAPAPRKAPAQNQAAPKK